MASVRLSHTIIVDPTQGTIAVESHELSFGDDGKPNGFMSLRQRTTLHTREKIMRDALISLGWIPPDHQGG